LSLRGEAQQPVEADLQHLCHSRDRIGAGQPVRILRQQLREGRAINPRLGGEAGAIRLRPGHRLGQSLAEEPHGGAAIKAHIKFLKIPCFCFGDKYQQCFQTQRFFKK
jgi:hypothetical protein